MNTFKSFLKSEETIFGALFTLWSAPIDGQKLDISKVRKSAKAKNSWFSSDLIVGYR